MDRRNFLAGVAENSHDSFTYLMQAQERQQAAQPASGPPARR